MRLTRPEWGLVQITPRPLVEAIMRRVIPGAERGWTAAGVDEFLRAYLTPAGRAAFYAAARHIYLDPPDGRRDSGRAWRGWGQSRCSSGDSATGWCRSPSPATSSRSLPRARHLESDCGHVPRSSDPAAHPPRDLEFLQAPGADQIDE